MSRAANEIGRARRRARAGLPRPTAAGTGLLVSIIALMVYLALLALAASTVLGSVADRWQSGLAGRWTVEIAPLPGRATKAAADRAAEAAVLLRGTRGVLQANPVGGDDMRRLLKPWLGEDVGLDELPLPALVDVTIDAVAPPDAAALRKALADKIPGATLDDHRGWVVELTRLATLAELVAIAVFLVVGAIALLAIVAAARARMAIHAGEVELLHVTGASDGWIAGQFQGSALRTALRGGAIGLVLAAATIGGGVFALDVPFARLWPLLGAPWKVALIALAVPAAAVAAATMAARWAAMRALARLP